MLVVNPIDTDIFNDVPLALNDPTDALVGFGSSQPNGWEESAAFYDRAVVEHVRFSAKIVFQNASAATPGGPYVFQQRPDRNSSNLTSSTTKWTDVCGQPRTKTTHTGGYSDDSSETVKLLETKWLHWAGNPSTLLGSDKKDTSLVIILPDTSPSTVLFVHNMVGNQDVATPQTFGSTNWNMLVEWTWIVRMYDRKDLIRGVDT